MATPPVTQPAASPSEPIPTAATDTGWRAKLPKIPDPVHVDLQIGEKRAFYGWLGVSVLLIAVGVFANWTLTDGAWVLPAQDFNAEQNPFGETEVQFLTTHPYDVLTAGLFVGSVILLAFSLLPARRSYGTYGWWRVYGWFPRHRHELRAVGWTIFALHWAATALNFFFVEDGDWVNMVFSFASVFVLTYFAYQEYISRRLGTDNAALRFAAAAVVIAATVWYAFLRIEPLSQWIIETVADHTVWMLHAFGQDVVIGPDGRTGFVSAITYPNQTGIQRTVIIILACTAIQSMMIFVAAALAVQKAEWRRRAIVIAVTVPIVYVLNLLRNVMIIFLWETKWLERNMGVSDAAAFGIAHNWIGKVGSLIALVLIALFVFRVLPEVVHAVIGLLDLPRRRGPLERYYVGLPAGSVTMGAGFATILGGLVWLGTSLVRIAVGGSVQAVVGYVTSFQFLDAGLTVAAGLILVYLGVQKRRRVAERADQGADPKVQPPEAKPWSESELP